MALPLGDLDIPKSLPSQEKGSSFCEARCFADKGDIEGVVRKAARDPQSEADGGMDVCGHAVAHWPPVSPG